MRGEFNRSVFGRGSRTARGSFKLAAGEGVSLAQQAKILRASDQVRSKVEKHHSTNQTKWVTKRYGELLSKAGNTKAPAPLGLTNDPKVAIMSRAKAEVAQRRANRIARVEKATANMLTGGKVRENRKLSWGQGLGE